MQCNELVYTCQSTVWDRLQSDTIRGSSIYKEYSGVMLGRVHDISPCFFQKNLKI